MHVGISILNVSEKVCRYLYLYLWKNVGIFILMKKHVGIYKGKKHVSIYIYIYIYKYIYEKHVGIYIYQRESM
jgi:hypothetical protein